MCVTFFKISVASAGAISDVFNLVFTKHIKVFGIKRPKASGITASDRIAPNPYDRAKIKWPNVKLDNICSIIFRGIVVMKLTGIRCFFNLASIPLVPSKVVWAQTPRESKFSSRTFWRCIRRLYLRKVIQNTWHLDNKQKSKFYVSIREDIKKVFFCSDRTTKVLPSLH